MNFATLTLLFFVYHSEAALKQSMEAYFHHRIKTSNSEFISCFFSLLTLYLIIWSLYLYLNNSFSLSHHSELIYCNFDFFLTILSVRETPQSQSSAPTITRSQSPDYWFPAPATAHQAPPYQGSLHTRSASGLLFTTWLTNATNLCVRTGQFPLVPPAILPSIIRHTALAHLQEKRLSVSCKTYKGLSSALQTCVISSEHLILSSFPLQHRPPLL